VPILGVNMGNLGFMTEVPQSEMYPALETLLAGKAKMSERMKLRVHLHRGGRSERTLDTEVLTSSSRRARSRAWPSSTPGAPATT
jgi:NAD+ kinase